MLLNMIHVDVTFHGPGTNPLTIAEPITLQNHDEWVIWHLVPAQGVTLPENAFLMIRFEEPLGPFQSLRGVNPRTIIGKGNKGDASPTSYTYFLYLLLDPENATPLVKSDSFTIENQSTTSNLSPWLRITLDGTNLTIEPTHLLLFEGDIALVETIGVPENHLVGFFFPTDPNVEGPFPTYFVTREHATGIHRLYGARFAPSEVGLTSYGVRIWDPDGNLVASHDPTIDGLGRPPD